MLYTVSITAHYIHTGIQASAGHTVTAGVKTDRILFLNSRQHFFFSPSPGWSRQTEHATAPAMPSASSFSSRHSLIPEVIRLRKAALKIKKKSLMFLSTFASTGIRSWKAVSTEAGKALRRPLLHRSPLRCSCCRENGIKDFISQRMFSLVFLGETGGSEFKKFWSEDVWSWEKGFWSYLTLTSEGRDILLCLLSIFCHPVVSR